MGTKATKAAGALYFGMTSDIRNSAPHSREVLGHAYGPCLPSFSESVCVRIAGQVTPAPQSWPSAPQPSAVRATPISTVSVPEGSDIARYR